MEKEQSIKEDTFGSWMLVKRNNRNKLNNKNSFKGEREIKSIPTDQHISGFENPFQVSKRGSRFAMLDLEMDGSVEKVVETPLNDPKDDNTNSSPHTTERIKESRENVIKVQQMVNNSIPKKQQLNSTNGRQEVNSSVLKSKRIMERFVKARGGGDIKPADALKASASSSFKPQKIKKSINHWDKTKALLFVKEFHQAKNSSYPLSCDLHSSENVILECRPPDPGRPRHHSGV